MAYEPATASAVKARFPAFAAVADALIEAALTQARRMVDETWLEDDRQPAEMLHAAHEMTLDGLGATREAQLQGFKRLKLGSLELERDTSAGASGSTYGLTTYGQRFMDLLRRNKPAIIALGGN